MSYRRRGYLWNGMSGISANRDLWDLDLEIQNIHAKNVKRIAKGRRKRSRGLFRKWNKMVNIGEYVLPPSVTRRRKVMIDTVSCCYFAAMADS